MIESQLLVRRVLVVVVFAVSGSFVGNVSAHPRIPALERFGGDAQASKPTVVSPEQAGRIWLAELNCVSCHSTSDATKHHLRSRQAPILDQVGARVRPEYVREYLRAPHRAKPGAMMPDVFQGLPDADRNEQIEAIVHFLASTGELSESAPVSPAVRSGAELFHRVGCVACHDARLNDSAALPSSIVFPDIERKYTLPSLTKFLQNPLAVRPSGRMPHLMLSDQEAKNIASFLLRDLQVQPSLRYEYFEGNWDEIPDFTKLKSVSNGLASGFDVGVGRSDQFAIRFAGKFRVDATANYRFHIGSDDGSRILIDGHEVAAVNGIHPHQWSVGRAFLTEGIHEVVVEYFEGGGEESLQVEFEGPKVSRRSLKLALIPFANDKPDGSKSAARRFEVNSELAGKGKDLFETIGCATCHALKGTTNRHQLDQRLAFDQMKPTGGCLADERKRAPDYSLSNEQREQLTKAIRVLQQTKGNDLALSPADDIRQSMLTFNCLACHNRDGIGGVEEARDPHFKSDEREMGDEGRLPPPLQGVGAKIRNSWMKRIFQDGSRDRPYMGTRMPKFGDANLGHLVGAFDAVDKLPDGPPIPNIESADRKLKSIGRQLVGAQGLSCIKCHRWGDVRSTGIQAISLTVMSQRLKDDWLQRYLFDPQQFRRGTRMPSGWPNGQTFFPKLLDGDVQMQIASVRAFLRDGDKATIPSGLAREPIELVATTEPIIYRNFIEGAGPRAIGVGYPEKVNVAFDANELRWALIWHGAFIDASRHWLDRGVGFQPPLGDNVVHLASGVTFATLDEPSTAWPSQHAKELGWQFRGYRLGENRQPTFLYERGELKVEDTPLPVAKGDDHFFERRLTLSSTHPVTGLWMRAAHGKVVAIDGESVPTYRVHGDWTTRIESPSKPIVREANGQQELLVPCDLTSGKLTIIQQFVW